MSKQAPNLNKRIGIGRITYTSDGMGGSTATMNTRYIWAAITMASGTETYRFGGSESTGRFKFTIRYRPTTVVSNSDVITYAGITYRITHIDPHGYERNYVDLYAEENNQEGA